MMSDPCAGKTLLILGAGVMQLPSIRLAREMGIRSLVVDGSAEAPGSGMADEFAAIDLKDEAGILAWARSRAHAPDGVFTAGTDFSAAVARLACGLGLPGMPVQAALRASDKALMREAFARAGVPSPGFARVRSAGEARSAAASLGFPLVLKPVDSMGARGCRRITCEEDLEEALEEALAHSRSGTAIIEEYLEGPEYSIDAIVHRGNIKVCGFADRHIALDPYFVELGHTMPTEAGLEERQEILRVFSLGVRALGIDDGAAKGDVKLCPDGTARVGEIAARLSGGYMSGWTYPYSSGLQVTAAAMRIALGLEPGSLEPRRELVAAERAWISIPGTIREVQGLDAAAALPHLRDVFPRAQAGSRVEFPRNNVQKCGNVIAVAPDRKTAVDAAEAAAGSILLRLATDDPRTKAFLCHPGAWPGPAFDPGPKLMALIQALPERAPGTGEGAIPGISLPTGLEAILESSARDWQGRGIGESLDAVMALTGARLGRGSVLMGRDFWLPFLRGGYQGGAWAIDKAGEDR